MMKHKGPFIALTALLMVCAKPARADFEAIQAIITYLGDVVQNAKEQVIKAKSLIESAQQLSTQTKKMVSDAKGTVKKVGDEVKSAKAKAQEIKDKVSNTINMAKSGDLKGALQNTEFIKLKGVFDGTKIDDEMADAVMDTLVRKKGDDSIANQKALNKALNLKQGIDMANMFGEVLVLRQDLKAEEDDPQNPESIDEAVDLSQESAVKSLERQNKVLLMKAQMATYGHTFDIQSLEGGQEGDGNE